MSQPTTTEDQTRRLFAELRPGDRVEVVHEVKVGLKRWYTTTLGTVVRTERRRHSLHFRRNGDDKVYSDVIVLSREDGELTTVTLDEFSQLRRLA
jgi:ribosomal protein L19